MKKYRYVWYFQTTGEFSNSWDEEEHDFLVRDMAKNPEQHQKAIDDLGAKLIRYECITDQDFEFCHLMKVVTNTKKR